VIVDYIDAYRHRFGVDPICAVLTEHGMPIAPSTYYAAKARGPVSPAALAEAHAAHAVHTVFWANRGLYGVRKMWHAMKRAGHDMGRDQVARLMRICGISGAVRGKRRTITTTTDHGAARHPDLIERQWGSPTRPDQWWVADFTYTWTLAGFVYTAFCVDVFSRRILGWRVMSTKATPLVTSVLEQAVFTRRRTDFRFTTTGLVHHSDAGSQYTSLAFTDALTESGIAGSIGSVGDALDNALMESAIGLYKTELIDRHRSWTGRVEVERETAAWVHWFGYAGDPRAFEDSRKQTRMLWSGGRGVHTVPGTTGRRWRRATAGEWLGRRLSRDGCCPDAAEYGAGHGVRPEGVLLGGRQTAGGSRDRRCVVVHRRAATTSSRCWGGSD
jgi:putative transposase